MLRRISLFAVVAVLAVFVLAACGEEDDGEEATVTRVPATNVPEVPSPTTAAEATEETSPAASPTAGAVASPEASPVAEVTEPAAGTPEATEEGTPAASETATSSTELTIDLLDIHFDPSEVSIPANTDVTITLVNAGAAPHTFDIDALNIHSGSLAAGESTTVTINAPAGDYEFYCAEPGHKQAGMVGTLHVVGDGGETAASAASPAASPVASPVTSPAAVQPVEVDLVDIAFSPKEITIPANTDVTVNLVNKGVAPHTFDIDQLNIATGELAAGESASVTINAAPGRYEYYCAVPGHKEAGMVGTLIVE
jgi:uncharacterized cupredoxin-like copper-binding protein